MLVSPCLWWPAGLNAADDSKHSDLMRSTHDEVIICPRCICTLRSERDQTIGAGFDSTPKIYLACLPAAVMSIIIDVRYYQFKLGPHICPYCDIHRLPTYSAAL